MRTPGHKLILASAGTGKTFRLTSQLLQLLFGGVPPERILATTFTRKAAGEILDRVLERLVQAIEDEGKLAELDASIGKPGVSASDCADLLARLTQNLHTLQVRTIDAFFGQLVRLFAHDLELPPDWRIASTREDEALQAESMQDVFGESPTAEMTELLRELQEGGVGRGVHRAMLERAGNLRPVLLESAEGAWERLELGPNPTNDVVAAALTGIAQAELPTTAKGEPNKNWSKAVAKLLECASEGAWKELLVSGLGAKFLAGERTYSRHPFPDDLVAALEPVVERACHEWLASLRARNLATFSLLERFEAVYRRRKRETGAYRFDDLPQALAPNTSRALPIEERELDMWFRLDGRVDHLLLDEFQDTSPVQWRILANIASEIAADSTGERSFFCVGDVKQSIYGFRQAEPRLLAQLDGILPGLVPEDMDKSYRSSEVVLETVNLVFGALGENAAFAPEELGPHRAAVGRWCASFHTHEAAKTIPGAVFALQAEPGHDADSTRLALVERALERVLAIRSDCAWASIGVLMRERKSIPLLIHRLRAEGVDASGEGGNELVDSEAVLAFIALLHLADHPEDSAAAFHVASSPLGAFVGIDPEHDNDERRTVARTVRARLVEEGLGGFSAALATLAADQGAWSPWDDARFSQLVDLAYRFEREAGLRPSDFVDHLRTERVEAPGGARVRVMTVHASKGLEFDAVVLPELHKSIVGRPSGLLVDRPRPDGLIETVTLSPRKELAAVNDRLQELYDQATGRTVEDSLSNLYVAMTRAARRLDVIFPAPKSGNVPTLAAVVRCALPTEEVSEPDEHGLIWSHPSNAPGAGWAAGIANTDEAEAAPEAPLTTLGLAPTTKPRSLPRRAPSAEEGGGALHARELLGAKSGARRGTLVHRWFEELEWIEDFAFDRERLDAVGARHDPDAESRADALGLFERALATDEIRAALSRSACGAPAGSELEVHREYGFSILLPDEADGDKGVEQLWTGSIDRLVLARKEGKVVWAQVLDYKTDDITAADLPARTEHYRPQLESYARVVAEQTGLPADRIESRLLFLAAGRAVGL